MAQSHVNVEHVHFLAACDDGRGTKRHADDQQTASIVRLGVGPKSR